MRQVATLPTDAPYKLVNYGIDTLVLNVRYRLNMPQRSEEAAEEPPKQTSQLALPELPERLVEDLDSWQKEARSKEELVPTDKSFHGANLFMYPHGGGKGQWRWILECPSFKLSVGLGHLNGVIAQIRLASEYLWSSMDEQTRSQDVWPLVAEIQDFLGDLLEEGTQRIALQVSSVDLCADIAGWLPDEQTKQNFITRARRRSARYAFTEGPDETISSGPHLATLQFGSHSSPLSARIYDKVREIKEKSKKYWVHDLWKLHGWDGTSPVERVEFCWGREALHDIKLDGVFHGIEDIEDLDHREALLWSYGAGHIQGGPDGLPDGWLRYSTPSADTNKSRWAVDPVWAVVQSAFCTEFEPVVNTETGEVVELPISPMGVLIRKRHNETEVERLVLQVIGCLSGLAARLSGTADDRAVLEALRQSAKNDEDCSFLDVRPDEIYDFFFALQWLRDHAVDYLMKKERKSVKDPFILDKRFELKYFRKVYDKRVKCGYQAITPLARRAKAEQHAA